MTHSSISLENRQENPEDPFEVRTPSRRSGPCIQPSSIDLRLGKYVGRVPKKVLNPVNVWDEDTYPEVRIVEDEKPTIQPKEFALAHTEEDMTIPKDSVAIVHGRSSVGRLGLFIHNAGLVDGGFEGNLTLELFNAAPHPIQLKSGMRICQMTVHPHDEAPEVGYSARNGNKYQGQSGPTASRLHKDFNNEE